MSSTSASRRFPPRRRASACATFALVAALAAALAGCATEPTIIGDVYSGAGPGELGIDGSGDTSPTVGWVEPGERFFVMTYGSSSCPTAPTGLAVEGEALTVEMSVTGGDACTDDLGPTVYAVDLPAALRDTDVIDITLRYEEGEQVELSLER